MFYNTVGIKMTEIPARLSIFSSYFKRKQNICKEPPGMVGPSHLRGRSPLLRGQAWFFFLFSFCLPWKCIWFWVGVVVFLFVFVHTACRILVPWPGMEPIPPAVGVWSLNCWTLLEVPGTSQGPFEQSQFSFFERSDCLISSASAT